MTYLPNIPAATDKPSTSQGQIQGNFQAINTAFALNHVSLGTGAAAGKHNFVEMPNQLATPTTVSGEGTLYTLSVTSAPFAAQSQLAYVSDNNPTEIYQLTRGIHSKFSLFSTNTKYDTIAGIDFFGGWTFLPGNLLLQYGTVTCPSGTVVPFPVTFTMAVYSVQVTPNQNTGNRHNAYSRIPGLTSFTTSQLDGSGSSETSTIAWWAIGV